MRPFFLVLAVLFVHSISAMARIGETPIECTERYGEPSATLKAKLDSSDDDAIRYVNKDVAITVEFKSGKAWFISFERRRSFDDTFLQGLLNANGAGTTWLGPHKYGVKKFWISANKGLHAVYTPYQGASRLVLLSERALAAMEEERERIMKMVGTADAEEWVNAVYGVSNAEGF